MDVGVRRVLAMLLRLCGNVSERGRTLCRCWRGLFVRWKWRSSVAG